MRSPLERGRLRWGVAAGILSLVLVPGSGHAAETPPDWMSDEGGVLELKLAHADKNGPDGGILRVDRTKRLLRWEGIPGDIGCKKKVEASFEDVKSVSVLEEGGFGLELKKGKTKKLTLIPVPHAAWFMNQARIQEGMGTTMAQSNLQGPGGPMQATGAAAGAGPSVKKVEVPKQIAADSNLAVARIQEALGREAK